VIAKQRPKAPGARGNQIFASEEKGVARNEAVSKARDEAVSKLELEQRLIDEARPIPLALFGLIDDVFGEHLAGFLAVNGNPARIDTLPSFVQGIA
jgi:hypothetical protein